VTERCPKAGAAPRSHKKRAHQPAAWSRRSRKAATSRANSGCVSVPTRSRSAACASLMAPTLLALLAGSGCSRGWEATQKEDPPSYVPAPVSSQGLSPSDLACTARDDCGVCSDGQCGEAMTRRRISALGMHCRQGSLCEPWNADCQAGRCVLVPPTMELRCVQNADCAVCLDGSECGQPMARARVLRLGEACRQQTIAKCRMPQLVCHAGRCLDPKLLEY
jgi:hypothetical protein